MRFLIAGLGFVLGAVIAAFGANWALRRARGEQAIIGRSHCDACAHDLSAYDTIPILSYAYLQGHCRHCMARIDSFHLWSEIGGALLLSSILFFRPWPVAALEGALAMVLWCLALVDLKTLTLPNFAVSLVAIIALIFGWLGGHIVVNIIMAAIIWTVLSSMAYGLKRLRGRTMLGGGDIKLITALTLWLGPDITLVLVLACSLGLVQVALKPSQPGLIAFGPAIIAASLIIGLLVRPYFSLSLVA